MCVLNVGFLYLDLAQFSLTVGK